MDVTKQDFFFDHAWPTYVREVSYRGFLLLLDTLAGRVHEVVEACDKLAKNRVALSLECATVGSHSAWKPPCRGPIHNCSAACFPTGMAPMSHDKRGAKGCSFTLWCMAGGARRVIVGPRCQRFHTPRIVIQGRGSTCGWGGYKSCQGMKRAGASVP